MAPPPIDPQLEAAWQAELTVRERRTVIWLGAFGAALNAIGLTVGLLLGVQAVVAALPARLVAEALLLSSVVVAWRARRLVTVRLLQTVIHVGLVLAITVASDRMGSPIVSVLVSSLLIWGPTIAFLMRPLASTAMAFAPAVGVSAAHLLRGTFSVDGMGLGLLYLITCAGVASTVAVLRWRTAREAFTARHETERTLERLVDTQMQLVQSEKLASLGQLVAGVAHELNTPLGAIEASVGNLEDTVDRLVAELSGPPPALTAGQRALYTRLLEHLSGVEALDTRAERRQRRALAAELRELGADEPRLMAGQLQALGVRAPLGDLAAPLVAPGGAETLARAAHLAGLRRTTATLREAGQRASQVVRTLRTYAFPGGEGRASERTDAAIAEALETTLSLMTNRLLEVEVVRSFATPGRVWAHHDELNQVWTHLLTNALHAMAGRGVLGVSVHADDDGVQVAIRDTGAGVPPDLGDRIFEPFFTTRAPGEGSGLGLAVCRDVVARHRGRLTFTSEPGETVFTVWLPQSAQPTAIPPDPT